MLGADRIQHGVRATEDPALIERLANDGVCLDVCPTSNVCLKVVPSIEEHPLSVLIDAGIKCSLNGDDPLFFAPASSMSTSSAGSSWGSLTNSSRAWPALRSRPAVHRRA